MKKIGIIRGGVSPQYDFSLKSGASIARAIQDSGFEVVDMLLDKGGILHIKGVPSDLEKTRHTVDLVWNALHGDFGEDGNLQKLLDNYEIPYLASSFASSALSFDKVRAKEHAKSLGIKTPTYISLKNDLSTSTKEIVSSIYKNMAPPWVIKPIYGSSSINTFFAFTLSELFDVVEKIFDNKDKFLVEQYIFGTEVAVGVIENFRNKEKYILPIVDIKTGDREVLSPETRLRGNYVSLPSILKIQNKEEINKLAEMIHSTLGAKDYSQSEFVVDRFGNVWFLEIDTHPNLYEGTPFQESLKHVGGSLEEFVKSIVTKY